MKKNIVMPALAGLALAAFGTTAMVEAQGAKSAKSDNNAARMSFFVTSVGRRPWRHRRGRCPLRQAGEGSRIDAQDMARLSQRGADGRQVEDAGGIHAGDQCP